MAPVGTLLPPPRSTRTRAHPHGPSEPPQPGHASSPLTSRSSTRAASTPTVSTAPPRATRPSRTHSAKRDTGRAFACPHRHGAAAHQHHTVTGTHQDPSAPTMPGNHPKHQHPQRRSTVRDGSSDRARSGHAHGSGGRLSIYRICATCLTCLDSIAHSSASQQGAPTQPPYGLHTASTQPPHGHTWMAATATNWRGIVATDEKTDGLCTSSGRRFRCAGVRGADQRRGQAGLVPGDGRIRSDDSGRVGPKNRHHRALRA